MNNKVILENKEHHTHNIINTFDNKKKKNLKDRTFISIFVFLFYVIICVFSLLSDQTQANWTPEIGQKLKGVFALLMVLTLYVPFLFCVFDALSLVFNKQEKLPMSLLVIFSSFFYLIPLTFLIGTSYFTGILNKPTDDNNLDSDLVRNYNLIAIYVIYLTIFFSSVLIVLSLNLLLRKYNKINLKNVLTLNFLMLLIPFGFFGFAFVGLLRGWTTLIFVFISIAGTDVMCYLSGTIFGKHKMAKVISPNKTWEGAIIGTFLTVALLLSYCGLLCIDKKHEIIIDTNDNQQDVLRCMISLWNISEFQTKGSNPGTSYSLWIILFFISLGIVISSILGDLLFSYIKRVYQIKDFGTALKSHGGFLDRFDSFLITSSVYFLYTLTALGIFAISRNIDVIFGTPIS